MSERSKESGSSMIAWQPPVALDDSDPRKWAWVRIPLLTYQLFLFFIFLFLLLVILRLLEKAKEPDMMQQKCYYMQ